MRNYEVSRVIDDLNRKHDCKIDKTLSGMGGIIHLLFGKTAKGDIGIKSRGKIDFLVKHHGFRKLWQNPDVQ